MMKSRLFLKNSARAALNSLLLIILSLFSGCYPSITPTYLKEDIDKSIQDICKTEYSIDVKVKLVGQTLWIYVPVDDLLVKAEKPEKYSEKFEIEHSRASLQTGMLRIDYKIKPIDGGEKKQEYVYNKKVLEKVNNVWKVLRRAIFSAKDLETTGPKFFCLVTADIKNGFVMEEITYLADLKKVSYGFISWGEYQHRTIQDTYLAPEIYGDREGLKLNYKDITLEDFIAGQIQYRIRLKFQKPEVEKNADIDKEVIKIVAYTTKTYEFKDFTEAELNNLVTQNKITINRLALFEKAKD